MHKGILGAKRLAAVRLVTSSIKNLAGQAGIDPDRIQELESISHRDPQITELLRLEYLVDILADLEKAGQVQDSPTAFRKNAAVVILSEVPGLTKTSREAITEWANAQGAE